MVPGITVGVDGLLSESQKGASVLYLDNSLKVRTTAYDLEEGESIKVKKLTLP